MELMTFPSIDSFLFNFSTLLRHYRSVKNFTQLDVASQSGISLRTYQRIELMETEPSLSQVFKLSSTLGFRFDEIFHFESTITHEQKVLLHSIHFLEHVNKVARVGGFELDLVENILYWTDVTKMIHQVPLDFNPDCEIAINFYKEGDSRNRIREAVEKCRDFGTGFDLELQLITALGNEITVVSKGIAETTNGKTTKIYGTFQDITHIRRTEHALRDKIEEINTITKNAKLGIWKLNLETQALEWSESLFDIFEINHLEFQETYEAFLNLIHPEDREKVNQAYTESLQTKKPYEVIHRLLMPDGRIKWILEKCLTLCDPDGKPLESKGYAIDITSTYAK